MDKFVIRTPKLNKNVVENASQTPHSPPPETNVEPLQKQRRVEVNLLDLSADPGSRTRILDYPANERDRVRREYLKRGPCQPLLDEYPPTITGTQNRRFSSSWYEVAPLWLEYNISKDAVFCLYCYLFKPEHEIFNGDTFISGGYRTWKKKDRLYDHVGGPDSAHNLAVEKCENLLKQKNHIESSIAKRTSRDKIDYKIRVGASFEGIRYLLQQGLTFRGHDETSTSKNQGNFLEFIKVLARNNAEINKVVLDNAPKNQKMTSADIQKDFAYAAPIEITKLIVKEIGNDYFAILVDESRDVSSKEQLAVVVRYVNVQGHIMERFLGITHVKNTNASTLKIAIEAMLLKCGLNISNLREQGYDGASNMKGEFNGLKALILKEQKSAYYIHCFAHQLQLALVAVVKNHTKIDTVFCIVSMITNAVGASAKRCDILREAHANEILKALELGEIQTGSGLNQEMSVKRPGDTRWSSHFNALTNFIAMYSSIVVALESIEGTKGAENKVDADMCLKEIKLYEFAFSLHLMKTLLGITHELSVSLQKKDQDIVNAMDLVKVSKMRIQEMRCSDDVWNLFLEEVSLFCSKNDIDVPKMEEIYIPPGRSRRRAQSISGMHHFRYELYNTVIDLQLQELNNRFNEVNTELLICVASLNPHNTFAAFDKEKLLRLAELYPIDFFPSDFVHISNQLETYIRDVRSKDEFCGLNGIVGLADKLVKTGKSGTYPFVYKLLKLALILPVATTSVERVLCHEYCEKQATQSYGRLMD